MHDQIAGNTRIHGAGRAGRVSAMVCCAFLLALGSRLVTAAQQDPRAMLQEMTDRVLAEIHRDPALLQDGRRLRDLADRYILPHIDFNAASQWVLGRYWRTATDRQRSRFVEEFRALLLKTYLRSINKYHDNAIHILPSRGPHGDRAEVDAEVEQPGGPPIRLGFRLHLQSGDWLIYDISVDGISLVATNRSAFSREIREQGLDGLIARLAKMNAVEEGTSTAVTAPAAH